MAQTDDKTQQVTHVVIFGAEYVLSSTESERYTQEISAYVDRKMKDIANEKNLSDTAKVAIMAAFDIADLLLAQQSRQAKDRDRTREALQRLERYLDGAEKDEEAA